MVPPVRHSRSQLERRLAEAPCQHPFSDCCPHLGLFIGILVCTTCPEEASEAVFQKNWVACCITHSSVLAWRIPGTAEPGGLPSMGLHRVGHDWSALAAAEAACCVSQGSQQPIVCVCVCVCVSQLVGQRNRFILRNRLTQLQRLRIPDPGEWMVYVTPSPSPEVEGQCSGSKMVRQRETSFELSLLFYSGLQRIP